MQKTKIGGERAFAETGQKSSTGRSAWNYNTKKD
jgi:hypothetical protein